MIKDYSFMTFEMEDLPSVSRISISPLSQFPFARTRLVGVEENYLNSIYDEFYLPGDYDSNI